MAKKHVKRGPGRPPAGTEALSRRMLIRMTPAMEAAIKKWAVAHGPIEATTAARQMLDTYLKGEGLL